MAIAPTLLTSNAVTTNATSYTTASISPTANRLLLAFFLNCDETAAPLDAAISGLGLTWFGAGAQNFNSIATPRKRVKAYFAITGASPGSGTITFNLSAQTHEGASWAIAEVENTDLIDPLVQVGGNANDNSKFFSVSLATFADPVNNATFGWFGWDDTSTFSPTAPFVELFEGGNTLPNFRSVLVWRLGNALQHGSLSGSPRQYGGIAFEVRAPTTTTGWGQLLADRRNRLIPCM